MTKMQSNKKRTIVNIPNGSNKQPGGNDPTTPDNRNIPQQSPIDPDTAKTVIESRPTPTNVYVPLAQSANSIAAGNASNTAQGADSIIEQARALKSNVDLIYQFVAENIQFLPTYGLQKGGAGTLSDGFGNSFDQADLMVKLLRQAGYAANYLFGEIELDATQLANWLGTDSANIWSSSNLLANGAIPNSIISGSPDKVRLSHVWVKWQDPSTSSWYVFDPSYKSLTASSGVDMASALSYNATTFMNNARSGATITADYVQNLNRTNIRNDLNTLTSNLLTWIRSNNHGAGVDEMLGRRNISAITPGLRLSSLPYQRSGATPTEWTSVPNSYKAFIHLVYDSPNIDVTFYSADIYGKRLTLSFNTSHQAELRLEGSLIATSAAQGVGTWNSILFDVQHPYGGTWANSWVWQRVWADKSYLIANSWGNAGKQQMQTHLSKLKIANASGLSDDSEASWGESHSVIAHTMSFANSRAADLINRLTNCSTVFHHACGLIGWFDTVLVDMGAVTSSSSALDNNYDRVIWNDTAIAMFGVSNEAAAIEATVQVTGISTTPLIDVAMSAGQKIYDAKTANWTGTVKPALTNYTPGDLTSIENAWINYGYRVGLPANGLITKGSWTGYGYWAIPPQGSYGIISGGLKGSSGSEAQTKKKNKDKIILQPGVPTMDNTPTNKGPLKGHVETSSQPETANGPPNQDPKNVPPPIPTTGDPLLVSNGEHFQTYTDITVGSAPFPLSLHFNRHYASGRRSSDSTLGLGWTHNWSVVINPLSDFDIGLGRDSALSCAPALAALFVAVDLQSDLAKPFDKYLTTSILLQWLNEQLYKNTVSVQSAAGSTTFVRMPNGTYIPPVSEPGSSLVLNASGTYTYKTSAQTQFNFDSLNRLATIVYPYGVTVTLTYTGDLLTSITNGVGRTLTLTYTSGRLTSVSDGTGRSVSYLVDASKNLVQATNALSKTTTFAYDLPGRLTQVFLPANPTTAVVTTVYDALDRVKQQTNGLSQTWNYYIAGSRSEEVDPLGNKIVYFFNRVGYTTKVINALNQVRTLQYDGALRQTKVIFPEGNSVEWLYNNKNFVVSRTKKAKPASGLADIVDTFTYDPTWNKVATITNALARVTTFTYSPSNGNLLSIQKPVVGGLTPVTTVTYNSRGQLDTVTDQTGIVTKFTYDTATENMVSITKDFGTGKLNLVTSFDYNAWGDLTSITDPRGNTASRQFDVLRRATQITSPAPFSYITKLAYTDNNQLSSIQMQTGDVLNPWRSVSFTYSITSKLKTVVDPSGHTTILDYDTLDRQWKVTDAISRTTEYSYDALSRISTIKDPSNTVTETRTYSNNGLLATIKDARNNATSYSYDGHDRTNRTDYPDGSYEQNQSYDLNGNILTFRTRSGNTLTMTYDSLDRLSTRTPQAQPTETRTYDLAGRLLTVSKPVVSGDPSSGTFTMSYDTAGRHYREQYPDGKAFTLQLDANGNGTRMTWPDGWYIERVYDSLNRLTDIKLNGAVSSAFQFQYDQLSRRKKTIYENGCVTDFSVELDGDPNSIVHTFVGSTVTFNHTFNDVGEILTRQISDSQYMWHPSAAGTQSYGTADSVNKYPNVAGVSNTFNGNGCLTGDGTWTFTYSTDNQLLTAAKTGTSLAYKYDPLGRQVEKSVGGTKTRFYYSGLQRLGDYTSTGALQTRYIYGLDLDEVLLQVTSGGVKTYFHHDQQLSVIASSNASGTVTNKYAYSPFGESAALVGTSHGYTGQRYEPESGLYYYKNRYYSPKLGRFLQPDPIGYMGGFNLYAYAANSPTNFTDPLGLVPPSAGPEPVSGGGGPGIPLKPIMDELDDASGQLISIIRFVEGDEFTNYLISQHSHSENFEKAVEAAILEKLGGAALKALVSKGQLNNLIGKLGITRHIKESAKRYGDLNRGGRIYDHGIEYSKARESTIFQEVKTGTADAVGNVLKEIQYDIDMARRGYTIEWHFYESPLTGSIGPTAELSKMIEGVPNIRFILHGSVY